MKRFLTALGVFLTGGSAQACGVALALAVDVSGSVDEREYQLQMGGLSAALRDGLVADALVAEKAAVSLVQWSGRSRQRVSVDWVQISTPGDVEALADRVDRVGRSWRNFSTGIGEAMLFVANQFARAPDCTRKVIDISGDGRSNEGTAPEDIGAALAAQGFVVNGLAIETDEPDLTDYYREKVIAGEAAFVVTAEGFDDYPEKIRRKLIREVTKRIAGN